MAHPAILATRRELEIRERAEYLETHRPPAGCMSQVQRDRADILEILAIVRTALIIARAQNVTLKAELMSRREPQHA